MIFPDPIAMFESTLAAHIAINNHRILDAGMAGS